MPPTRSSFLSSAATVILCVGGCAALGKRDAPNTVVPVGSEWVAPAAGLRSRHYEIAEVDTIIGFVRGIRTWSDGSGTLEDELTVEIYRDGTTNRLVKRVTVQTHRVRRGGVSPLEEELGATTPSRDARRDAEAVLGDLGCPGIESEQRMTLGGPVFLAWCSGEPGAGWEPGVLGPPRGASTSEPRAQRPARARS